MPRRGPTSDALLDGAANGAPDTANADDFGPPGPRRPTTLTARRRRSARTRHTGRPGEVDPQAAPRVGSSPYPGLPYPLGATPYQGGTNFAVVADGVPGVSDVQLCLVDANVPGGAVRMIPMDERTYGIWHTFVPDVGPGQIYGFRVPARDPAKILLDPYARQVTSTTYDLIAAASSGVDTLGKVPLAVVCAPARSTSVRPWVPWEQTVIYEAHVEGLTRLHPDVPPELRGTFKGVCAPGRHRTSEEPVGDDPGTAAGPGQRRGARPARHQPPKLLGLLHSRLFRTAPRVRDRTRPGDHRVHRDGRRAACRRHRGRARRGLQPHLRRRARPDRRPLLARPVGRLVLPARRQGHHRHREHAECRHAAGRPDGHRLPALLGRHARRRRLPLRPRIGARPTERWRRSIPVRPCSRRSPPTRCCRPAS